MKKLLKLALCVGIVSAVLLLGSCSDNATEASGNIASDTATYTVIDCKSVWVTKSGIMNNVPYTLHEKYTIVVDDSSTGYWDVTRLDTLQIKINRHTNIKFFRSVWTGYGITNNQLNDSNCVLYRYESL